MNVSQTGIYLYILVAAGVSFLLRVLPMTLIRKKITNKFFKSFLYYVPYVTLAIMVFPAIINATDSWVAGTVALAAGVASAWFGLKMISVAVICCLVTFAFELLF